MQYTIFKEKIVNKIVIIFLAVILVSPLIFKIEPEVMFSDKKEIVSKMGNELNVPTVFFFNSSHNRFLDDILLFATVDNSYIAKDIEYNELWKYRIFKKIKCMWCLLFKLKSTRGEF